MALTYKKLQVVEKGKDFSKATKVVSASLPATVNAESVLIKNIFAGVNATDINAILNRYGPKLEVPYDIGLESLGQVVRVGAGVETLAAGDYVVSYFLGGYAEYQVVPATACLRIPKPNPEYLALNVSGLTAAVALGEVALPKEGEVALVTAAAGGTGSIAVQILKKKYKCRVVGTCSSQEKAEYLMSIGCDVVIDYKKSKEEVMKQLAKAAPNGFDVIYESVGGPIRELAMQNLAVRGRVIIVGGISGYKDGSTFSKKAAVEGAEAIIKGGLVLRRSAWVSGFMLPQYRDVIPRYYEELLSSFTAGDLVVRIDEKGSRSGLERIAEAVEFLYTGKSYGKIVVKLADIQASS